MLILRWREKWHEPKWFYCRRKNGSKRFRNILTKNSRVEQGKNVTKLSQVKTFARLTGSKNTELNQIRCMMSAWNNSFLPGKIRTFLFKFYNNILGINSRVAKFNLLNDPSCTFCSTKNFWSAEKETFAHLFYYCETTSSALREFLIRNFTINVPEIGVIFSGAICEREKDYRAFQLVMDEFRYHIWNTKLEKKSRLYIIFLINKWYTRHNL